VTPHDRLIEHLAAGGLDAVDHRHATRCAACASLLPGAPPSPATAGPAPDLLSALHREAARPPRRWWHLASALGLANALLAAAAVRALEPWNWEISASPHWLFVAVAAVLAVLATVGVGWALAPGRGRLRVALLLASLAPLGVLGAADGHVANDPFIGGIGCLWVVLALSALPLAGGLLVLTRTAYVPARALAVGLAAAGVSLLVLQFHCADGFRAHLAVFHLLPWAALGGAAVLVRRRLPTWSHAP
jgi:hypothetical protein